MSRCSASGDGAFWTAFLRSLKARGLHGTALVISDAHTGLKSAIAAVMIGSSWQRCRVHFLRNVLARVPRASAQMVLAAIRTIFAGPDAASVQAQLDEVAAKRVELRATMETSKVQYEELLKNQPAAIAKSQTTKTETVTVPVQKKVTTSVSKPASTRSTKSS